MITYSFFFFCFCETGNCFPVMLKFIMILTGCAGSIFSFLILTLKNILQKIILIRCACLFKFYFNFDLILKNIQQNDLYRVCWSLAVKPGLPFSSHRWFLQLILISTVYFLKNGFSYPFLVLGLLENWRGDVEQTCC